MRKPWVSSACKVAERGKDLDASNKDAWPKAPKLANKVMIETRSTRMVIFVVKKVVIFTGAHLEWQECQIWVRRETFFSTLNQKTN